MRRTAVKVTVLLLLALAVHAAFFLAFGKGPLTADGYEYAAVAKRFSLGLGLTSAGGKLYVHSHPPLYPAFIGLVFRAGGDLGSVRLIQMLLSVAALALAYAVARAELGRRAADWTLLLGALYLPAAFYSTQILSEAVFAFPLALGLLLLSRGWRGGRGAAAWYVGAGLAFGLAALVRALALPMAVAVAAYLLFARDTGRGRRWVRAAAVLAGTAVVMAGWSGYVYAKTSRVVLVDTSGAAIFYIGNNPRTPFHHAWDALDDPACSEPLRRALDPAEDGFRVAAEYRRAALDYVWERPLETAARMPGKFLDLFEPERLFAATARNRGLPAGVMAVVAAEMAADAALLLLWGVGLALMPSGRLANTLRVLAGVTVLAHVVTYAYPRYHVPLLIVSLPAAAYAVAEGLPALFRRELSKRRVAAAAAVALVLLLSWGRMALLYALAGG
ncbi:MAG: glycosyltransferase family 39 protein [Candidatus Zixiibacteriota bacterium]|jgi:4-amino-4-deoxy-L-arabinose transferase-like glycosyltransferase